MINHVVFYEKTLWKYWKFLLFNAIPGSYIVTHRQCDLIFKLDEIECLTTAKYQSYYEHAISSSDKRE